MSKLERTVKDLIIFYVKENYNNYLKENNLSFIHGDKLKQVIDTLYDSKKDHLKQFLKDSLKELLKDDYPGDLVINNICYEIFEDDDLCKNRVLVEIKIHQENNI
jgi:hypothetical protein